MTRLGGFGETFDGVRGRVYDALGGCLEIDSMSEAITLSTSGTTTDSAADLLPAGAVLLGVTGYVGTTITGSGVTGFKVGDGSDEDRFSAEITTLTAGDPGFERPAVSAQLAAAPLRITAVGGTPSAGVVQVTVWFLRLIVTADT